MAMSKRQFSLLVPLKPKTELPEQAKSSFLTDEMVAKFHEECEKFNENVKEELKEMNQNKITNIIERGGVDKWETAEDLGNLSRTFEFSSFEQANAFIQQVGIFCSKTDHHPEWTLLNDGKHLHVKLTSHFNNNKVTPFDFELAEQMNKQFRITQHQFRMFPYISSQAWTSLVIGVRYTLILLFVLYSVKKATQKYPSSYERMGLPQSSKWRPLITVAQPVTAGSMQYHS